MAASIPPFGDSSIDGTNAWVDIAEALCPGSSGGTLTTVAQMPQGAAFTLTHSERGVRQMANCKPETQSTVKDPGHAPCTAGTGNVRQRVDIPILGGDLNARFFTFHGLMEGREHFALRLGQPGDAPLVRLHSECMTGDVFRSMRCDCGPQLEESLRRCAKEGGYVLYLRHEGRGIGLYAKLDAYHLQNRGLDTYEANRHLGFKDDQRNYADAATMLRALDVHRIRLLSNNPDKQHQLEACGIEVVERIPTGVYANVHNIDYLRAKRVRSGHNIRLNT
jgi:GTP cyclohydrolase II